MGQMELGVGAVQDGEGNQFVRWAISIHPLSMSLTLAPDAMQQLLDWANENLPKVIAEVRLANNMKGFEIIGEIPPGINGQRLR